MGFYFFCYDHIFVVCLLFVSIFLIYLGFILFLLFFFISVSCLVALRPELMKGEEKLKLYGRRSRRGKSEFF